MTQQVDILLVDDHEENLLALEAILVEPSYNLVRAPSGRAALKEVLKCDFALILLDVAMPDLDGYETAELISQPHALPVLIEEELRELDHGELEGLTFNEIKTRYGEFLTRWRREPADICVPGGERLADVAERAWNGLNEIVQCHPDSERILVVSHNFPILGIVCRISGTHLNDYRTFHLDPCGVTRLNHDGARGWTITHVNSREYPAGSPADQT